MRINLVSTSTGGLAFAVTDLTLPGVMPILFQRVYDSARKDVDSGLGAGWSFVFDDRIVIDGDAAVLTTGLGSVIRFQRDGQSQHFVRTKAAPDLHQSFDVTGAVTVGEQEAGLSRTYQKIGGVYRLSRISDINGNAITITFDARGKVSRIDNGSAALALEWTDRQGSHLLAVADSAGRHVTFKHDGQRLRTVTDPNGMRWAYGYTSDQLTEAADPLGRTLLHVRYDKLGRAIEAGDAAGTYSFEYDPSAGFISQRTIVTDPVGAKTVVTHTADGAPVSAGDDEGQAFNVEYNGANRPERVRDTLGNETRFAYDARNRLLRQTSGDGSEKSYAYDDRDRLTAITDGGERTEYALDARGNVSRARSADPAQSYDVTRDSRGRATSIASKGGRTVALEYDARGNETVVSYSDALRFERQYDAAGFKVSERFSPGLELRYKRDARGLLTEQSDSTGRALDIERDPSGAVTGLVAAGGAWVRAARDEAGRIVTLTNSSGKSRHFSYDARGSLVGYTDARGRRRTFGYDHRGRLRSATDADGVSLRYDYDRAGKLIAVRRDSKRGLDLGQYLRASFTSPSTFSPAPVQDSCTFGGDEWFEGDTFGDRFGMNCGDPLGGFGDSAGDAGGIFDGSDPRFCSSCIGRNLSICEAKMNACLYQRAVGGALAGGATCAAIAI
ncbi:MAG: DUF6531 domain-containing protein, partial [Pyrinomonadaceae bacterium]